MKKTKRKKGKKQKSPKSLKGKEHFLRELVDRFFVKFACEIEDFYHAVDRTKVVPDNFQEIKSQFNIWFKSGMV